MCLSKKIEVKYDRDIIQLAKDEKYQFNIAQYLPDVIIIIFR